MPSKIRILKSGPKRRRVAGGFPAGCQGDRIRGEFWSRCPGVRKPGVIVGIDPGANGAVAVLGIDGAVWGTVRVFGDDDDASCDAQARRISHVFRAVADAGLPTVAVIETTFAPRNARGYAAMRLGESRGMLIGLAIGAGLPPLGEVGASVWQADVGALTGGRKKVSRDRAKELFPEIAGAVTNATADALLIAEWTRRQFAELATWRK